jgi:hypothetical protein
VHVHMLMRSDKAAASAWSPGASRTSSTEKHEWKIWNTSACGLFPQPPLLSQASVYRCVVARIRVFPRRDREDYPRYGHAMTRTAEKRPRHCGTTLNRGDGL